MNQDECSILILGCDKYKNVLRISADFFSRNWADCPFPIYVGLEKEKIKFNNAVILNSEKKSWGARVIDYLNRIKTKFVMIILDDFVIEQKVETDIVLEYLNLMGEDHNIANIAFVDIFDKDNRPTSVPHLMKRKAKGDYLINMQIGIWDKDFLAGILDENFTPWEAELYGSIRARKYSNKRTFLCLDDDNNMPIKYNRGWLIVQGKWNANEIIRLNLYDYSSLFFDGKRIQYDDFEKVKLSFRIKRRFGIEFRKALSNVGIYI